MINNATPINIIVDDQKPKYFGSSGICLYQADTKLVDGEIQSKITNTSKELVLGKSYFDIATFLANKLYPSPRINAVGTYTVYGNPDHLPRIAGGTEREGYYSIVGYLDQEDIKAFVDFYNENRLDKLEGVQAYADKLEKEVVQELQEITGLSFVNDIHSFTSFMPAFYFSCIDSNDNVVIIGMP